MWRNRDPSQLLVEIENGAAAVENIWRFLKKLNTDLPYVTAIPLLGTYPKESRLAQKLVNTCSQLHYSLTTQMSINR